MISVCRLLVKSLALKGALKPLQSKNSFHVATVMRNDKYRKIGDVEIYDVDADEMFYEDVELMSAFHTKQTNLIDLDGNPLKLTKLVQPEASVEEKQQLGAPQNEENPNENTLELDLEVPISPVVLK